MKNAMGSRFLHRAEHWLEIIMYSTILENCKHSLDLHSKQSLGKNMSFDHYETSMISILIICF